MKADRIRLLRADEIECRIGTINENGLSLLLYKDARVDQKILDETFGPFAWARTHEVIDGDLFCTVSIFDEECDRWVSKQDVGVSANAEKEKSRASDAFKRACVNWGIGRELYSAPFIWINAARAKIQRTERSGKEIFFTKEIFSVSEIFYDEEKRSISALSIINQRKEVVYSSVDRELDMNERAFFKMTARQKASLDKQLERTGVKIQAVLDRYGIRSIDDMSAEIYKKAMDSLKITADKAA